MRIKLSVFGSLVFFNLLKELNIFDIKFCKNINDINDINNFDSQMILIVFPETLNLFLLKKILSKNLPLIYIINNINFLKLNNIKLSNYQIKILQPVELMSFVEITKILSLKYNFFKNSNIVLKNNYFLDCNQRIISKDNKNIKLTEKELNIIISLNNSKSLNKEDLLKMAWNQKNNLDSHAFETNLHRIRKKIYSIFGDNNFIMENDSRYYIN